MLQMTRRHWLSWMGLAAGGAALPLTESQSEQTGYSIFEETMVDMPWPAIQQAVAEGAIVLLPISVVEEHGPHLNLAPDIYLMYLWSQVARRALEARGIRTLIAPSYYWGINASTGSFPGSFTVRPETFKAVLYDIHASLQSWNFSHVFSLNLHGDPTHNRTLQQAVKEAHDGLDMNAYCVYPAGTSVVARDYVVFYQPPAMPEAWSGHRDVHAGAFETGLLATWFPHIVDGALARALPPSEGFEPNGYWGDPANYARFEEAAVREWTTRNGEQIADAIEAFMMAESGV